MINMLKTAAESVNSGAIKSMMGRATNQVPTINGRATIVIACQALFRTRPNRSRSPATQAAVSKGKTSPANMAGNVTNTSRTLLAAP